MKNTFLITLSICATIAFGQETKSEGSPKKIVDQIVEEFRTDPLKFKKTNLDKLVSQLTNSQIDDLIPKLLQGNTGLPNKSDAAQGAMGYMNKRYLNKHNKTFSKKIKNNSRDDFKVLMIEGDSWFNFPTPNKTDITKLLLKKDSFLVYTSAFGGDWLANMLKEQSYFEETIRLRPDALILSGGGNDIVGARLSSFVDKPENNNLIDSLFELNKTKSTEKLRESHSSESYLLVFGDLTNIDDAVLDGTRYLNKHFFEMLVGLELQYKIIHQQLKNIKDPACKDRTMLITQGYDYPIPRINKAPFFCNPWRAILNRALGSGKWLYTPLKIKGIDNPQTQENIMRAMIYYFNEVLIKIATQKDESENYVYPDAFHIDNRGLLAGLSGSNKARLWFDELHPKALPYEIISRTIYRMINTANYSTKVTKTTDEKLLPKENRKKNKWNKQTDTCRCFKVGK